MKKCSYVLVAALTLSGSASFNINAANFQLAPLQVAKVSKRIVDQQGQILYTIDLVSSAHEFFPGGPPAGVESRFHQRHSHRAKNMALAFERAYGFQVVEMTSWVGNSLSAYLTLDQVERLRGDPLVTMVSEVVEATFSGPPWSDFSTNWPPNPAWYEFFSWGWSAANGQYSIAGDYPRTYMVDAGVGFHTELPNVITRVAASSGVAPVGCYSHGTFVAGVINATFNNVGVVGVLPGLPITSVSALTGNISNGVFTCGAPDTLNSMGIGAALDWVRSDLAANAGYRTGIVNVSINSESFGPGQTNRLKLSNLATPAGSYAGAFVTQSAGNRLVDACNTAYGNASPNDGIMVVGAIGSDGDAVVPVAGQQGFLNAPYAGNEPGSNFGPCVEAWAPGNTLLGIYGPYPFNLGNPSTWQNPSVTYGNYAGLGGTSFAAPHVAAIAAHLAKTQGLVLSTQVETAVRNTFYNAGRYDRSGGLINYVRIP